MRLKAQNNMEDQVTKIPKRDAHRPPSSLFHFPFSIFHSPQQRRAFTLTEILVIITIIVLMLSMAMPVFRMMSGSRSQESATNQIVGMLGRARSQAIGLQQNIGVAFFADSTGRSQMALVQSIAESGLFKPWSLTLAYSKGDYVQRTVGLVTPIITYWVAVNDVPASTPINITTYWQSCDYHAIDQIHNTDAEPLPQGVGVKLINDWGDASAALGSPTVQVSDGYLSVGVIMFDKNGQITKAVYSVPAGSSLGSSIQLNQLPNNPYNYPTWPANVRTAPANSSTQSASNLYAIKAFAYSQFGLVVFDRDAYTNQGFTNADPTYTSSSYSASSYSTGSSSEKLGENWLDNNSSPLLINRYTGTLVKSE